MSSRVKAAMAAAAMAKSRLVGVVGAGQMGSGIAQVAATRGFDVFLCDSNASSLDHAMETIKSSLARLVKKGVLDHEDAAASAKRISLVKEFQAFEEASLVVEAVTEKESLKMAVLQSLDKAVSSDCILASNTSSISITRLAAATSRPDKVIGMHWMNPPPIMHLIEIIRGIQTSDETMKATRVLAEDMGKTVVISADRPGFIVNRILMPMINEAFFALMEGVASPEDIDTAMKLGTNQPMGPLALADLIGLDTCLSIMRVLHNGLGESKYRPCPLMVQYVDAGYLGRKTGRGVYDYTR